MKIKTTKQILQQLINAEFYTDSVEWISIDNLCEWLQETFGNSDNINLILNEISRCRKE